MKSPLAARLRAVMRETGNPALENRGLTTEEIGSTADAAITIARLKQENLDQMEIHALEQDVALIQQDGETVEELETATEEITELKADLESYRESGGLTMRDATHVHRQLKSMSRRFGFQVIEMPAMESFRGSTVDRIALTVALEDSSDNFLVRAWKWIVKTFKDMWEKVKGWFGKSKDTAEKTSSDAKSLAKYVEAFDSISLKDPSSFKKILGDVEYGRLSATPSMADVVGRVSELTNNTKALFSDYNALFSQYCQSIESMMSRFTNGTVEKDVVGDTLNTNKDNISSSLKNLLKANISVTDESKDGTIVTKSKPMIAGKVIKLSITDKGDNYSISSSTSDLEFGEKEKANDVKFKEDDAIPASSIKDLLLATSVIADKWTFDNDKIKARADVIVKYLDKEPKYGESMDDESKKKVKKLLDVYKTAMKFVTGGPIVDVLTSYIAASSALNKLVKKAADEEAKKAKEENKPNAEKAQEAKATNDKEMTGDAAKAEAAAETK